MSTLGSLSKPTKGNHRVGFITDRYEKRTRAIPTAWIATDTVKEILFNAWVISYDIPAYLLADNGRTFVSKCFDTLCRHHGTRHLTTTAYRLQTSGHVERYNITVESQQRQNVAKHQHDWDSVVQAMTYMYIVQVCHSTGITSFSLVHSRQSQRPTAFDALSALPMDEYHGTNSPVLVTQLLNRIQTSQSCVEDLLGPAQNRYKEDYDAKIRRIQTLTPERRYFIDSQPLAAISSENFEYVAQSYYNKLML